MTNSNSINETPQNISQRFSNENELFESAERYFKANDYAKAEPILSQMAVRGCKNALVFHMLGTMYYNHGKFNKAIRTFKRALEIDPSLTDASIGLSIILNDLGRYEEGQKVFHKAQAILGQRKAVDPKLNENILSKHLELGDLYCQAGGFTDALEQFEKALNLSKGKAEITLKIVECHLQEGHQERAMDLLRVLCKKYPQFSEARLKLGKLYYDFHQVPEAIFQWERVLQSDPYNHQAKEYLRLTQSIDVIHTYRI